MVDDISKLLREMKDISVSFTSEDLIQNMASILNKIYSTM
jgi:hypothetical protein